MNYKKLESAVKRYSQMILDGAGESDIKAALLADEKKYSAEEVEEIYNKLAEGIESDSSNEDNGSEKSAEKKEGRYIVTSPFADKNNRNLSYSVGDDISHFDQDRLNNIVERGLAKVV